MEAAAPTFGVLYLVWLARRQRRTATRTAYAEAYFDARRRFRAKVFHVEMGLFFTSPAWLVWA